MASIVSVTLTGTTESAEIDLVGKTITRIQMSDAWTSADLNFTEAFETGDTFRPLYDENGGLVYVSAGATQMIAVDPRRFQSARRIKFVSSASQGSARTLRVMIVNLTELVYRDGGLAGTAA